MILVLAWFIGIVLVTVPFNRRFVRAMEPEDDVERALLWAMTLLVSIAWPIVVVGFFLIGASHFVWTALGHDEKVGFHD